MKRIIIAAVVILALGALTMFGNRILGRTLDAELAPLLSRQLGLPVELSPITAHLPQLKATSEKLVMGDPGDPAVVATAVEVTLAWADLLQGDIRFVYVSASDLMVRPSRWPSSDGPLPDSYQFLDPWLPRTLELASGRYVSEGGDQFPVTQLRWQRHGNGSATAQWTEAGAAGNVSLQASLKSLPDLLQLAPIGLDLTVEADGKTDSTVTLKTTVQPGTNSAYALQLDLQAATMTARIAATGQTAWELPDYSETTIPLLDSTQLSSLVDSYRDTAKSVDVAAQLAASLPRLDLPAHKGHVAINEIHIKDETYNDTAFDFTIGEQGVQVSALTSTGVAGIVTGDFGITSDSSGWTLAMDASLEPRETNGNIAAQFVGSNWLLHTGRAKLHGKGDTWGNLLNSLQGDAALAGNYKGAVETPVAMEAQLDKRPGEFALEHIAITLGKGKLSGSAVLSGTQQNKLSVDLEGANLDLGFLFNEEETPPLPGMALPEYLGVLPELELNVALSVEDLQTPALRLGKATATLERTALGGKLVATARGADAGVVNLTLVATAPPNEPSDFTLTAKFSELDIPDMFRQQGLFYSRSTGSLNFRSRGDGMKEVFTAMQGAAKVSVDVRSDNDWKRRPVAEETLEFTGNSHLVLKDDRIVGVQIEKLDINSIEQAVTGSLSLTAGQSPWFVAKLESDRLNVDSLLALLPKATEEPKNTELLPSLQRLGATQVSLAVKALRLYELPLSDVQLQLASGPDTMTLTQFDFTTENGALKSQAKVSWKDKKAILEGTAELSSIDLDQFLISDKDLAHVPVSGSAKLSSAGRDVEELLSNLTGYIDLQAVNSSQGGKPEARRKLALKATRLADGMQADISSLQWGETDLSGSVRYRKTTPPLLEIDIHSGSLSLLPWENAYLKTDDKDKAKPDTTSAVSVARKSADFVGNMLLTPFRLLADDDSSKPGAKLFSSDPLPLDSLDEINVKMSAQLDSLLSTVVTAKKLSIDASLDNGLLSVKGKTDDLSQGSGEVNLSLDANAVPATLNITSTFANVRGLTNQNTFPRSGFVSLQSQGQSEAELAAHTNGLLFLELGKGPFDYANSMLLTANLAASVFKTLIPGIERKKPELQCGITVALFKDGEGATPYGFAARTKQANLLGHVHIDLGKETLQMNIDSRGREGVGLSVGSIFSNTIQIKGPLTDPGIVPDTVGLVWRGWAAVMTGGLSVLGESLVKRVLASENPCTSIKGLIVKDLCPTNQIAASSPMLCPTTP